jgi:hypothetical protein
MAVSVRPLLFDWVLALDSCRRCGGSAAQNQGHALLPGNTIQHLRHPVLLVENDSAVTTRDPMLTQHGQEIFPKLATNVLAII